jgi:hypothetical protein
MPPAAPPPPGTGVGVGAGVGVGLGVGVGVGLGVGAGVGAATETVRDWLALPPAPVQISVKVLVLVRLLRTSLPVSALLPLQAPDAVQVVALLLLQLKVLLPPDATLLGLAENVRLGAGVPPPPVATITLAVLLALPHESVKLLVAVRLVRTSLPLSALLPLHAPEALQDVAPLLLQLKVLLLPLVTLVGLAVKLTLATGTGVGVGVGVVVGGVVPHRSVPENLHDV